VYVALSRQFLVGGPDAINDRAWPTVITQLGDALVGLAVNFFSNVDLTNAISFKSPVVTTERHEVIVIENNEKAAFLD
jgi:hypothetical protein